jgi:hypothetical protein
MWTVLLITFTASVITLRSMRRLPHSKIKEKTPVSKTISSATYIVAQAEYLPQILNIILKQLHLTQNEVTLEIVFTPKQVEFLLHIPSSISLPDELQAKLVPIEPIWSAMYNRELIVDDNDSINNSIVAHQIIIKSKTPNIVYLTTRGVKKTPTEYHVSGIDTYKWDQFINKRSDSNPDLITHDRIFTLIQEKLMTY